MKTYFNRIVVAGLLSGAIAAGAPALAQDTIKIGVLLPVSGGGAAVGLATQDGVKLAVQEINDAGGVNGKKLEILVRDTQMKPDVSNAAAKELITKEGVTMFIGPATSAAALAVSQLAKEEKVVNISPTAKAEAITAGANLHDYIFQLPPTTDIDGKRSAEVLRRIGAKKVCFAGFDYAYTHDLFKAIKANLGDIQQVNEILVPLTSTDYSTMVTQLVAADCDTIMGTMFGGGFIAFAKQAQPFGLFQSKKLVWGSNMGDYAALAAMGADFPEGMWASAADVWYWDGTPEHKKFQEGLAKLQGRTETDMWPITGYNAVYFLKAAIEKAGSTEPDAVAAALKGVTIDSPLGKLTIDPTTHRAASPEFYGQVTTVPGSKVKQMSNLTLVE